MIGIYKITSPTDRVYIGQSVNIKKRFLCYKRLDCKKQRRLFYSLRKHGVDSHTFEVICKFDNRIHKSILNYLEQFYIDAYRTMGKDMLNLSEAGIGGYMSEESKQRIKDAFSEERKKRYSNERSGEKNYFFGKKHTAETRAKMSEHNSNHKIGANNGRARAILQYDLNGNFLKEWDTITNASKELNIFRQAISDNLNGRIRTSGGFIWKYKL